MNCSKFSCLLICCVGVYSTDKQQGRSSNINQDLHKQTENKEEDVKSHMKPNTQHSNPEPFTPETIDNSKNNTNSIISSDVHADVSEATPIAPSTEALHWKKHCLYPSHH